MADTNHGHETPYTERDGIAYAGLGWSMAALAVVTLICYGIVVGLFKFLESRELASDPARAPLAAPMSHPTVVDGRLMPGNATVPTPLLINEPMNLEHFRAREEHLLTSYSWMDQNAGTIRMPIDRAKDLLLERGLTIRTATPKGAGR